MSNVNSDTPKPQRLSPGLLWSKKGKIYPYEWYEGYLYGFDNRYGVFVLRACDGPRDTLGAEDGLYEVTLVGMGLKASEIRRLPGNLINKLIEILSEDQRGAIVSSEELSSIKEKFNQEERKYEALSFQEITLLISKVMQAKEREATHIVKDSAVNPNYTIEQYYKDLLSNS